MERMSSFGTAGEAASGVRLTVIRANNSLTPALEVLNRFVGLLYRDPRKPNVAVVLGHPSSYLIMEKVALMGCGEVKLEQLMTSLNDRNLPITISEGNLWLPKETALAN